MTQPPECLWAPVDHRAPAVWRLRLSRPCGHYSRAVPTCVEHFKPVGSSAERLTVCEVCGQTNSPDVVDVRPI